jgi:hypothetical protein
VTVLSAVNDGSGIGFSLVCGSGGMIHAVPRRG